MKKMLIDLVRNLGLPRLIIFGFFLFLLSMAITLDMNMGNLISDILVRIGMWLVLALAMLPAIKCGIGPNFGISVGILCGSLSTLMAVEYRLDGFANFFAAVGIGLALALVAGYGYGWLLNRVKGSEMVIATFVGFSAVSVMKIGWQVLPFKNPEVAFAIGDTGVRPIISLVQRELAWLLNRLWAFDIGNVTIPTGLLLFGLLCCLLMWLFMRSKTGLAMQAAGNNPRFAEAAGINVDRCRIIGTILSTMLGAVGTVVYFQAFGFMQLYEAPMFMPFTAVAAPLIGGATIRNCSLQNVIIGTSLFMAIFVVSMPVANIITSDMANMGEITRSIVQNGVILYALASVAKEGA